VVTVIGLGFVGLTTALCFAELGKKVYGVEINEERFNLIKNKELPFFEPQLDIALEKNINNNFVLTKDLALAIKNSEVIFLCVGTPAGENGEADLTDLKRAVESVLSCNNDGKFRVIVVKSTVAPSRNVNEILPIIEKCGFRLGDNIGFACNPEFLREGHCYDDFMNADRIVIGTIDEKSKEIMNELYKVMDIQICNTNINTAEFVKYLSNTLLATLISYSNEMSMIAQNIGGIDIKSAFNILAKDKRFDNYGMTNYVYPGCGYGGYCLPKDTKALYNVSQKVGFEPHILKNVISLNENMPRLVADRLKANIRKEQCLGILGLSFKPESNDTRQSVSAKVIKELVNDGYNNIIAYDPIANDEFKNCYPELKIEFANKIDEVAEKADVITILTGWDEFKKITAITNKKIMDFRYIL